MGRWVILILILLRSDISFAQPDSVIIKKIAAELSAAYVPVGDESFFDALTISKANSTVLTDTTSATWKYIHSQKRNGKQDEEFEILMKVLPRANREFLRQYYLSHITSENLALYNRVNKLTCDCININNNNSKTNYRETMKRCWENSQDSSLKLAYAAFISDKLEKNDMNFLLDVVGHVMVNCDKLFNQLMAAALARSIFIYSEFKTRYQAVILENCTRYSALHKIDSLVLCFPQYGDFQQPMAEMVSLYKNGGNELKIRYEFIFQGNKFERYNALIIDPSAMKTHILGQAVIEIGTDKARPYLKKINFYPREGMQNINRFEKQLDDYEAEKEAIMDPDNF